MFDQQFVQPTFGLGGKRETTFSQPAGSTRRPEQMQRQLPLLPFHSPDRLVGVMLSTQSMHDSRLAIWLQPGSHRSGRLETQMQQPDGRICNQVFEHPQRLPPTDSTNGDHRLSTSITGFDPLLGHVYPAWSNEAQPHVVRLAPGDLFFFHPLLAHRLLFEENRPPPPRQSTPLVNILALQLWFGASEILPIRRNFASADSSLIFETRTIDGNKTTHPKFFQRSANADGSIDDNVSGSDASVDGQLATAEGDWLSQLNVYWHQSPENHFFGASLEEFDSVSFLGGQLFVNISCPFSRLEFCGQLFFCRDIVRILRRFSYQKLSLIIDSCLLAEEDGG